MAYTVFFREGNEISPAHRFIDHQPSAHHALLKEVAETLAKEGRIAHPLVGKTSKGEWSVLIQDGNDVYQYTLFISALEQNVLIESDDTPVSNKELNLVIVDPSGPRDSIGGYHPGYWSITHYASLLEEQQRELFLRTIAQIVQGVPSDHYTLNNDGSVSIHIHKQGKAYAISIVCRAEWQ